MKVVVDASVAAKWYADEDDSELAELLLQEYELHAPQLILTEFATIVWKKLRSGEMDEKLVWQSLEEFLKVPLRIHSHEGFVESALKGAIGTGQSVYDWTYLASAISLNSKLVTADRKFFMAMRKTRFKQYLIWIEHLESLK